jgi:fermentation-respiration switch protein FrsA (DUF1100 family)
MMNIIIILVLLYGVLVLGMGVFQRKLMYHPAAGEITPTHHGLPHFEDIEMQSEDGTKLQLWYHEAKNNLPTIIYFHGNAGHLGDRAGLFEALAAKGLGVAAVGYRGYGKSHGKPHEKGIYADARASVKWVKARGIGMSNVAFYGESLGTGVAVMMTTEFQPKYLFLQAPYTSVVNRAAEMYWFVPVRLLIRDHFDSLSRIHKIRTPLMIFHGRMDPVIPIKHAQTLLERAVEPKRAIFFDTVGHTEFDNDLLAEHVMEALNG